MKSLMDRPPSYAPSNNIPSHEKESLYDQGATAFSHTNRKQRCSEEEKEVLLGKSGVMNSEEKGNWKRWVPKRTRFMLRWFVGFILGSIVLTLAAIFGCYSTITSWLHIVRIEPYTIFHESIEYLNVSLPTSGNVTMNSTENSMNSVNTTIFFSAILPWRYEVGIAGVCRVYNNSKLSSPLFTTTTKCTPQLHPPVDLLTLIGQDVPDGKSSEQFKAWEQLFNKTIPNYQYNRAAAEWGRLVLTSSVLLVLSIIWSIALIITTIFIKSMYPRWSLFLDIIDAVLVICASTLWTNVALRVRNTFIFPGISQYPFGVQFGPGILVMWVIALVKLSVTPMMSLSVVIAMLLAWAWVGGAGNCCGWSGNNWTSRNNSRPENVN